MEHYLDNAATTAVCRESAEIALRVMTEDYGNPGSTHKKGRDAKKILDNARSQVAAALGCEPKEVYFCSCGSEADNWAIIRGAELKKHQGRHIISSTAEHDAVRKSLDYLEGQGYEVTRLNPGKAGNITAEQVLNALREDTVLISLMLVNNEIGAVTDIAGIAAALRKEGYKGLIHTDAVQGFLKIPFSAKNLGVDMITVSGHKIHAPKGIAALYIREGIKLKPYILGGGQENYIRAGTEALPQIAAFGEACRIGKTNLNDNISKMTDLQERILAELTEKVPLFVPISQGGAPHILSISLPGYRSEVIMNFLEARGVYVSKSSACKKGARSHVLEAMGLSAPVIDGAIRIGLSRYTTDEDIDALISGLQEAVSTLSHR